MALFGLTGLLGLDNEFKAKQYQVDPNAATSQFQPQYVQALQSAMAQRPGVAQQVVGAGYQAPQLGQATQAQGYMGPSSLDTQAAEQLRQAQMQLVGQQQNVAAGGNSVAQAQLFAAQDANARAMQSAAASQRGDVNPALTQRSLMDAYATQGQQTAQQYAALRAQEMQSAQSALGQTLMGARTQDMDVAQQNAQLGQANAGMQNQVAQFNAGNQNQFAMQQAQLAQAAAQFNAGNSQQAMLANQSAGQQQQQINNAQQLALLGAYGNLNQNTIGNQLTVQQLNANDYNAMQQINAGVAAGNAQTGLNLVAGGLGAAGAYMGLGASGSAGAKK